MTNEHEHFTTMHDGEYTAWNMLDGHVMTGKLVRSCIYRDAFTVLRPDGTTCHVPANMCRPATVDDRLEAGRFFEKH